mmetsp:Transcript_23521/g.32994  ORF Transcript_23521/g.32994 Transcript_23521/m.32994 type:complete len:423 (+) Transcript_23521:129-1397(+)
MSKFWSGGSSSSSVSGSSASSFPSDWDDDDNDLSDTNDDKEDTSGDLEILTEQMEISSTSEGEAKTDVIESIACWDPDSAWKQIEANQKFVPPPRAKPDHKERSSCTRFVLMSDTHGKHRYIAAPKGDVLIHGGDFTKSGEIGTVQDLSAYFGEIGYDPEKILCIAGNHENTFHPEHYERVWQRFHREPFDPKETMEALTNCTYLEDDAFIVRGDLSVYGSPWTPFFFDWAFNLDRGQPIREVWQKIPLGTDVLVTHGPPLGRGDKSSQGDRVGCYDLLMEIQQRVHPRLHVFGHVHEGHGVTYDGATLFVNASSITSDYRRTYPCVVVDVPHDKSKPAIWIQPQCDITPSGFLEFLKENNYTKLLNAAKDLDKSLLPGGSELLDDNAYDNICNSMSIHRDKAARDELLKVLSQIHAASFDT